MSLRLFAAVTIPETVADRLAALQKGTLGASWRPRENFHLTLRFFGEVDETQARELDYELGAIAGRAFDVSLSGAGWFGGERPRALWIGVVNSEPLKVLAERCERAARRAGLEPERRKFTPHVTLAYCHGTGPDDAAKFAQRAGLFRSEPFLVDRFALYSSWLGKGPSQYVAEAEYPLVG